MSKLAHEIAMCPNTRRAQRSEVELMHAKVPRQIISSQTRVCRRSSPEKPVITTSTTLWHCEMAPTPSTTPQPQQVSQSSLCPSSTTSIDDVPIATSDLLSASFQSVVFPQWGSYTRHWLDSKSKFIANINMFSMNKAENIPQPVTATER